MEEAVEMMDKDICKECGYERKVHSPQGACPARTFVPMDENENL